ADEGGLGEPSPVGARRGEPEREERVARHSLPREERPALERTAARHRGGTLSTAVCGIAGIWERSGRLVEREALERMGAILRHRGPDGSGVWLDGEVGLANRRLAVVDPTPAGDQPLALPERGRGLPYNGEIHH